MAYARNCLQLPTLLEKCVVYAISKGMSKGMSKGNSRASGLGLRIRAEGQRGLALIPG